MRSVLLVASCSWVSGSSSEPDISEPPSSDDSSDGETVDLFDRLVGLFCESAESESGSDLTFVSITKSDIVHFDEDGRY